MTSATANYVTTGDAICAKCGLPIHGSFTYVNSKPHHDACVRLADPPDLFLTPFVFRLPWICTRCGTSNAPHIDRCLCTASGTAGTT